MNKFKKISVGIIVAAGVSCLGSAVACTEQKPDYYQLTFEGSGIEYVLRDALASFESGGTVRKGLEVSFTLALDEATVGTPVIFLNDEKMSPDGEGVYSFVMEGNSVVKAEGLNTVYTVTLDRFEQVLGTDGYVREERRIHFTDENGKRLGDEVRVPEGGNLKFKLDVSSYYVQSGYTVSCDTTIIEPDANGVYTLSNVKSNSTVTVSGLTQEGSFVTEENVKLGDGTTKYGTGTAEDPFKLSKPIDLYYLAVLVNDEFYGGTYNQLHYKLTADIDMGGEQLFIIGDTSTTTAVFCGTFDGDGHTISNFYITDEAIEQSTYEEAYLPFVGLFGQAVATLDGPTVIKNVKLDDYEVRVHPASAGDSAFVGSLVGFGIGVQISGCEATNASMVAFGDDEQMIYMGGLAGLLQGAYSKNGRNVVAYDTFVSSCSTDILMQGLGSPRSMGGIVGYLVSADESATAYVIDSRSEGDISGGMHCGGIVGTLARYSTVISCSSSSAINASNEVDNVLLNEDYRGAYAGGIVGYAEEDTVVYGCLAANRSLSAYSVAFPTYAYTDPFAAGRRGKGYVSAETSAVVLFNNSTEASENNDSDEVTRHSVVVKDTNGATIVSATRTGYAPIHVWYSEGHVSLDEYATSGNKRTWGYYFDEELTLKVPYGFVPDGNVTLYAGLADYNEVAGRYYIRSTAYSDGAYFDLTADGVITFRNGGMTFEGTYSYNGDSKEIVIFDTCFALLNYSLDQTDGDTVTVVGRKSGNGFTFTGKVTLVEGVSADGQQQTTTEDMRVSAAKAIDNFKYGEYYAGNDLYRFGEDGTGAYIGANERLSFTYREVGGELEISLTNGGEWSASLTGGVVSSVNGTPVTAKNNFNGSWVTAANSTKIFVFDGVDNVTYKDGNSVKTVKYTVSGGEASFTVGGSSFTAVFEGDVLKINRDTCLVYNGFFGGWYMPGQEERIDIALEGYGKEGYGHATISYFGDEVATLTAQYDVMAEDGGNVLRIYVNDMLYGELLLDENGNSASGLFYSLNNEGYYSSTNFYPYDNFKGTWVSASDRFDTVTFNGKTSNSTGEARIINKNNTSATGTYVLTDAVSGKLTVGATVYNISFDFERGTVSFEIESESFNDELAKRDDWYGVVLYEGETSYSFDGKGNTGNGTVTLSDGTLLGYNFGANGELLIEGDAVTASGNALSWNGKTLVFKTGYNGRWLVSGTRKYLTVGEVKGDFTAEVSFEGVSGTFSFTFDPSDGSYGSLVLVETQGNERVTTKLTLLDGKEMSIERESVSESSVYNCIAERGADKFMGTYAGENGSWTFDGLGNCRYADGTATFKAANGAETSYRYSIDRVGNLYIRSLQGSVFAPVEEGGYVKEGEESGYAMTTTDAYHDRLAIRVENQKNVNYVFDGLGGLWREGENGYEKIYSYEIVAANKFTLTDDAGNTYNCTLTAQGRTNIISITAIEA